MDIEAKVSSTFRVTIPAPVRDVLEALPGDAIRCELAAGSLRLRVVRLAIEDVLEAVWAKHDLGDLRGGMGGDAGAERPLLELLVGCTELMFVRRPAALLGFLAMAQISVAWTVPPDVLEVAGRSFVEDVRHGDHAWATGWRCGFARALGERARRERAGAIAQCHCVIEACTGGGGASGSGLCRSHACSAPWYVRPWCAVAVPGHGSHAVHACRAGDGLCRLGFLQAHGRGVWSR